MKNFLIKKIQDLQIKNYGKKDGTKYLLRHGIFFKNGYTKSLINIFFANKKIFKRKNK